MGALHDYDVQVEAIRTYNQPILAAFQTHLEQANLGAETVRRHVGNIQLFTHYLVYYEPLKKLDEASSGDVSLFLSSWYPRKAPWVSAGTVKSNLASFKKFFQWMSETGYISPKTASDVLTLLKRDRESFIAKVPEENDYEKFSNYRDFSQLF